MSDERVGTLDHPARYGKRACSVYHNSRGYYVKKNQKKSDRPATSLRLVGTTSTGELPEW